MQPIGYMDFKCEKYFVDQCQMTFPIEFIYPVTDTEGSTPKGQSAFSSLRGNNQHTCIHSSILRGGYTTMW